MRNKYFYPIFKLKAKSWIRYWLLKKTEFKGKLSEILTGFSFNLQNTLRQKFKIFEIQGHSEQESTSIADGDEYDSPSSEHEQPIKSAGDNVNLFDKDNVTNAYLNADGTTTSNSTFRVSDYIDVSKFDNITISGNYGGSELNCFYDENKTFVSSFGMGTLTVNTKSVPSNAKYIRVTLRRDVLEQYKLEPGSKATPWSPYGMGSITEKIINRNWLLNGKIFTPRAGGWYDQLGTVTTSLSQINSNTNYYDLKANTNYTIKIDKYKNINAYQLAFIKNNAISAIVNTTNLANPVTFKPTVNMRVWLRAQIVETNVETYFDAQLELGSTATDYVTHEEQTYSIYTQQPFRSIGDVRDFFFKNTIDSPYYDENLVLNGWYERHNIRQEVLDGTETAWTKSSTTLVDRYIYDGDFNCIATNNNLCNYFKYNQGATNKNTWYTNNGTHLTIFNFAEYGTTTLEQWKAWLNIHNLKLIQPLVEPIDLPCTPEQIQQLENIPSTFAGQTNVFSEDEVKAYLKIQYWESDTNG